MSLEVRISLTGWEVMTQSDRVALGSLALAAMSFIATVFIPIILHRLGKKADVKAREINRHLQDLQEELFRISAETRRDRILEQLKEVADPQSFVVLRSEAERFTGDSLRLLRTTYRQNPLERLPHRGTLTEQAADDFVASLPRRLESSSDANEHCDEFVAFARVLCQQFPDRAGSLAGPFYRATSDRPLPHSFYRKLVVHGHWRMAPALVGAASNKWDAETPARGANLLTGVFVGLKDIELGRPTFARVLPPGENLELQKRMRRALASLLHCGPLSAISQWTASQPAYCSGFTEPLSAMVAWMVRAVGQAVEAYSAGL